MTRYRRATTASAPRRPELGMFISNARDDYWADDSAKRLTPASLAGILREAEQGDIARQCELFDKLEEDPHIAATYAKRKRAAVTKGMRIEPAGDGSEARVAAELCDEVIKGIQGWREALYHLVDAVGRGFAACQIVWSHNHDRIAVERLQWWKQRDFVLDSDEPDQVRVLTDMARTQGEPLAPYQWIVHRYKARSGTLAEAPLLRGLAWAYLFKHSAWRDWVIFSEAYGMPRRLAYYPRGASDEEKRAAWAAARMLGRDAAAALPEGARLEFLKAETGTSQLPFLDLIDLSDRYISKLILGQTLTTEVGSTGGNRALGEVHRDVERDLMEADCEGLAETLRDQLCAPIVWFNLGGTAPVPRVAFDLVEDEDLLDRAKRDHELYDMGVPLSLRQVRETYGLDAPAGVDDRLVKPPQGSAMAELMELVEKKKEWLAWVT